MAKRMKFERSGGRSRIGPPGAPPDGQFGQIPHEATTPAAPPSATEAMASGGEDVVRGNSNLQPLTAEGRATAAATGQQLAELGGGSKIVPSTAQRAQDTAQELQAADPNSPPIEPNPGLESQSLGQLEGEPQTPQVKKLLADLIRKSPNAKIPGQGAMSNRPAESFNEYRIRVLSAIRGLMQQLAQDPSQRIIVPDHSHVSKLVKAWEANGEPDDLTVSPDVMVKDMTFSPGMVNRFAPDAQGNWHLRPFNPEAEKEMPAGSLYFVEHGQTAATKAESSRVSSGQQARAQIIKYIRAGDPSRARAVAQKAIDSHIISEQDVEEAIDEAAPDMATAQNMGPRQILAAYASASPQKRQEMAPLMQSWFGDLSSLHPDAQAALAQHLKMLG